MTAFDRNNPFRAKIVERIPLCRPGSQKNTHHLVLDIEGSNISYQVGDCVAILPENDPEAVGLALDAMGVSGSEVIADKRQNDSLPVKEFLTRRANICGVSRKLAGMLGVPAEIQKEFVKSHHISDALTKQGRGRLSPQDICDLLMPLAPRFYSIASSMRTVGSQIHLTVALLQYDIYNTPRRGVCTHWLCTLAPMHEPTVPLYIHPHAGFTLPKDPKTPIIMIGPGTGIAPYRGFMQERMLQEGVGKSWLFFGEWHRDKNFFYEDFWQQLRNQGKLELDTAFSRDQAEKVYVQHKMLERGEELYRWIEEGAVLYVCGDATRMAKDVHTALHEIMERHGKLGCDEAKEFVKALRKEGRYLRDVY